VQGHFDVDRLELRQRAGGSIGLFVRTFALRLDASLAARWRLLKLLLLLAGELGRHG